MHYYCNIGSVRILRKNYMYRELRIADFRNKTQDPLNTKGKYVFAKSR
jgi:hypothetical protein